MHYDEKKTLYDWILHNAKKHKVDNYCIMYYRDQEKITGIKIVTTYINDEYYKCYDNFNLFPKQLRLDFYDKKTI